MTRSLPVTVLCINENGEEKIYHASSPRDELKALASCSVKSEDPMLRVLNRSAPENVWLSTFTAGPLVVEERTGEEFQVAVSVIGNPSGNNKWAVCRRLKEILPVNELNPSFRGPILIKVETPERFAVNPAAAFATTQNIDTIGTTDLPGIAEACKKVVREFECAMQWTYCPRKMKRPFVINAT